MNFLLSSSLLLVALHLESYRASAFFDEAACNHYAKRSSGDHRRTYFPASVSVKEGVFTLKREIDPDADVYGFFNDRLNSTGWGVLEFRAGYGASSVHLDTPTIFRAAGYLEGYLTARRIQQHRCNLFYTFFGENPDEKKMSRIETFFERQDRWTRKMIKTHAATDALWRHAGYILAQLDGLVDGYLAAVADDSSSSLMPLRVFDFRVVNAAGDMSDLQSALFPEDVPDFDAMTKGQLLAYVRQRGRCSALVKLLPGYEDVFVSHSTWFVYGATNRVFKHYDFRTRDGATAANAASFSSYPGSLESIDDYYLMNNDVVMIQTTNQVFDKSLFAKVESTSLLAWQRVRVANHLAANGSAWFDVVRRYNSGTYNNQYVILDLKKIHAGRRVDDHALWVVEQIPGLVVGEDATSILRNGHWPSYNVPYFEVIFKLSGYPAIVEAKGTDFSYQLAPRAKIFRRDAPRVSDMASMKALMRYNDFPNDEYAGGSPWAAICSRGDLDPVNARPVGCYDTKVTNLEMARRRRTHAINGPTRGTGLGVFRWDDGPFRNDYHWGTPASFNFTFVEMNPTLT